MKRFAGRAALITGAARGVGRAVASRLAGEGAAVVITDRDVDGLRDLAREIGAAGGQALPARADVRDQAELDAAVAAGRAEFGPISICVANAGVASSGAAWSLSESQWTEMIDINLNGAWRTCKAVVPAMLEDGQGGSIVVTASTGSVRAFPNLAHYTAAKHGVLGLVKALAAEVAAHSIRVNAVLPTVIETEMALSQQTLKGLYPGLDNPTRDDAAAAYRTANMLPIPWVEASDVSAAIAWLCSDEARYITAVGLPVDAGSIEKHMG